MNRLEREILTITDREEVKLAKLGLQMLKDSFDLKSFEYSSLKQNIAQEFQGAKWVVLTNPYSPKSTQKGSNIQ